MAGEGGFLVIEFIEKLSESTDLIRLLSRSIVREDEFV